MGIGFSQSAAAAPTAAAVADAVWDELIADHAGLLSYGNKYANDNVDLDLAGLSLTFDNARFTMTASQTTDIIPATGESDNGLIVTEVIVAAAVDNVRTSADSGTNFVNLINVAGVDMGGTLGRSCIILGIGNSTGRYRITTDATVGTRTFQRMITTNS